MTAFEDGEHLSVFVVVGASASGVDHMDWIKAVHYVRAECERFGLFGAWPCDALSTTRSHCFQVAPNSAERAARLHVLLRDLARRHPKVAITWSQGYIARVEPL